MHEPLVSIIIPTYNRANLIAETLDSIINQTYTNWECLVVDDGSTDNTAEILKKYKEKDTRISCHNRPKHRPKGANACRNYGFEICNGEYVNWFDSDDIMHSKKIEKQLKELKITNSNFVICKTSKFENNIENALGILKTFRYSETSFEDFITKKNIWLTQAPLFNKTFLITNNLKFDENLQASQEWDFFSRMLSEDSKYAFLDEVLVYLRVHSKSISNTKSINMYWHYYLARKKIFNLFNHKFNTSIKYYFLNYFLELYFIMISNKEFKKAHLIIDQIQTGFNLSIFKQFQLKLSYWFYRFFGKGYFLIKQTKK